MEFCASHGVALVKGKAANCKGLVARSATLAASFRQGRFAQAFRDTVLAIVERSLAARPEPRPATARLRAHSLLELLFGDEGDDIVHAMPPGGPRKPTKFYEDLLRVAERVDLGAPPAEQRAHWR